MISKLEEIRLGAIAISELLNGGGGTGREGIKGCETSRIQLVQTIGWQMAVRLSALCADRALAPKDLMIISVGGSVNLKVTVVQD
jgi:hypothetical protein